MDEVLDYLLRDANCCGPRAEENGAMFARREAAVLDRTHDASHNNGASALNIVIEHRVLELVFLKGVERVLPIFELDYDLWPAAF